MIRFFLLSKFMILDVNSGLAVWGFQKHPSRGWPLLYKEMYIAVQKGIIEVPLGPSLGTISSVFIVDCILQVSWHFQQLKKGC